MVKLENIVLQQGPDCIIVFNLRDINRGKSAAAKNRNIPIQFIGSLNDQFFGHGEVTSLVMLRICIKNAEGIGSA